MDLPEPTDPSAVAAPGASPAAVAGPPPTSDALLAKLAAEVRTPSPPGDGSHALRLAEEWVPLPGPKHADIELVRSLFARPGHFWATAARTLLRFVEPAVAAAELRRRLAGGSAMWRGAVAGEVEEAFLQSARGLLADDDVRSLLRPGVERTRLAALDEAARRRLLGTDELLQITRSDASDVVRANALERAVAGLQSGWTDRELVAQEILRVVQVPGDPAYFAAIDGLARIGPEGLAAAADMIQRDGLPSHVAESLAYTLVSGGRIDALSRASVSGDVQRGVITALAGGFGDDAWESFVPSVVALVRSMPFPGDAEDAATYCALALNARAPDVVTAAVARREIPEPARIAALGALAECDAPGLDSHALAALRAALVDVPVDAGRRRAFLSERGAQMIRKWPATREVVADRAEHDPDAWVRTAAASALRGAAD